VREPIVLCYHAVSRDWDVPLAVTPARLERQIRRLLRLGFRPARLTDAVLLPKHERTFVVTFDDAFRSVLRLAKPILDQLGVPATLFVPTGWVGDEHPQALWKDMAQWRRDGHEHELELMDWDEIRSLADHGWEIGAHTHSHPFLTRLDDAALADELVCSREIVEAQLSRRCLSIAYPYGDVDERVAHAAQQAGFATGVGLHVMRAFAEQRHSDLLQWRRVGVYAIDTTVRFEAKLALLAWWSAGSSVTASLPVRPGVPTVAPATVPAAPARVAVIVPCFNDGALAMEAVASVAEDELVEIVVVDDASTDPETATALDTLRSRGVAVLRHDANMGLSAARRTGLAATTAPFVFPLDSDDLLLAGALKRLADRLEADPAAAASFGDIQEFGTRSRRMTNPVALDAFRVAYRNDYPVCSLFRRDTLEAVGAWQDVGGMIGYEDWGLWMTLAERWDTAVHAGPGFTAVRYRLHGPRMHGDATTRHRRLYAELKRTHPRLFAEIGQHRRRSTLSQPLRMAYPLLFGGRPPLGLRTRSWALAARLRRALGDAQ